MKLLALMVFALFFGSPTWAESEAEGDGVKSTAQAVADLRKTEAETVKLYAEAMELISRAQLQEAERHKIYLEMERLRQVMRITEYEFQRIVKADAHMNEEIEFIRGYCNLVKPLYLGIANWKTWLALDVLLPIAGDADAIALAMIETTVEKLPAEEFISNDFGGESESFAGGSVGEMHHFMHKKNYSFKRHGKAHRATLKILGMIVRSSENKIRELRDINQAIRFTIAKLME